MSDEQLSSLLIPMENEVEEDEVKIPPRVSIEIKIWFTVAASVTTAAILTYLLRR